MDIRFIVVLAIIAMGMDFMGRMARKRQGLLPPDQDEGVEGADMLDVLMGEERQPFVPRERVARGEGAAEGERSPSGERPGDADRRPPPGLPSPTERLDRLAAAREAAESWMAPIVKPPAQPVADVPVPSGQPPVRETRALELRDRAPREIEVRSREPRSTERRPLPVEEPRIEAVRLPAAPTPAASVSPSTEAAGRPTQIRPAQGSVGDRLGLGSATALRRAVLVREVLGPPLALRDEGRPPGGGPVSG